MSLNIVKEDSDELKKKSLRGGITTLLSQFSRFFLQILATIIFARLLSPKEHGLIVMVTALTGFCDMFRDLGLSLATIQKREISQNQISNLFWINLGFGFFFTIMVSSLSPLIGWFYSEDKLIPIAITLSLAFLFSGLSVQHESLLKRDLKFGTLSLIEVSSFFISIALGIYLATLGASYWSLVAMNLMRPVVTCISVWCVCKWRPSPPRLKSKTLDLVKFGANVTGFNMCNYFARNMDNVLIGKYYGSIEVGIYQKAYQIMMLPIINLRNPINNVAIPVLSKLQNNPSIFQNYYIQLVSCLAFISMPITVFSFVCADNIINLLLGSQWIGVIPIFKILALASFIQPVASTKGLVLVTLGQTKRYLYWGILNSFLVVVSFAIGIKWGTKGIALAYALVTYLILIPSLIFCFNNSPVKLYHFFKAILYPVISSLVLGIAIYLVKLRIIENSDIIILFFCSMIAILIYTTMYSLLPNGFNQLLKYKSYFFLIVGINKKKRNSELW